jgi:hypothetical protein
MTLENALTYLVALALPVWLVAEQVMIRLGRAERQGPRTESAPGASVVLPPRGAEPGPRMGTPAPAFTSKAA